MKKNTLSTSFHKFYIKNKTTKNHWVWKSLTKPIDIDELFNRRVIISEFGASLTNDNAIEASGITEGQTETAGAAWVAQK